MVYLPTVLAKSKGYFAEEGLDVEILDIKGGGSQAASALIGGSVDFSANAIDHAIKAKVQKKDLVAVHSHVRLARDGAGGGQQVQGRDQVARRSQGPSGGRHVAGIADAHGAGLSCWPRAA